MAERIDDLQLKGLKIIQDTSGFCFGVDAVLLSHMAQNAKGDNFIDLCSGNGIVAILLAAKTAAKKIYSVEILKSQSDLAKRSIKLNNLSERVEAVNMDLKNVSQYFKKSSFDAVTCNPPYMQPFGGIVNPKSEKAIARHEIACTLEDVICAADYLLAPQGKLFLVHKPERLVDIFCLMRQYKIEPKRLCMVHPSSGKKANIVLVEGVKNGGRDLKLEDPIYVYDNNGNYSEKINQIYRRDEYKGMNKDE